MIDACPVCDQNSVEEVDLTEYPDRAGVVRRLECVARGCPWYRVEWIDRPTLGDFQEGGQA